MVGKTQIGAPKPSQLPISSIRAEDKYVCGLAQAKGLPSLIYHETALGVRFVRGAAGPDEFFDQTRSGTRRSFSAMKERRTVCTGRLRLARRQAHWKTSAISPKPPATPTRARNRNPSMATASAYSPGKVTRPKAGQGLHRERKDDGWICRVGLSRGIQEFRNHDVRRRQRWRRLSKRPGRKNSGTCSGYGAI